MIRRSARVVSALAALFLGCSSSASDAPGSEESSAPPAWVEIGETSFQEDGESSIVTIPAREPLAALALRATTAPGVCFQLSSVVDGEGRAVVSKRSAGPHCRDCVLRTSVAVEAGVFVFPAEAGRFQPETGLSLRFARVNCATLTPLLAPEDQPPLRIEVQPVPTIPEQATVELRLHIAGDSILHGDEARQQALLRALEQELAPGGIVPRLVETVEIEAPPEALHVQTGDLTALSAWSARAPSPEGAPVDVYAGGCLLLDNPILGPPSAIQGFTPRIPGGAGPADGVYLPGLDCFSSEPDDVPVHAQARVLAHELGHHLGLYHTVEADGQGDPLDDTGSENLMHPSPMLAASSGLSREQGRILRMHASLKR